MTLKFDLWTVPSPACSPLLPAHKHVSLFLEDEEQDTFVRLCYLSRRPIYILSAASSNPPCFLSSLWAAHSRRPESAPSTTWASNLIMTHNPISLLVLLLLGLLIAHAAASPVLQEQVVLSSAQSDLKQGKRRHRYEHGELPPLQNTIGWHDPRLNGGRFLDVSVLAEFRSSIDQGGSDAAYVCFGFFVVYHQASR